MKHATWYKMRGNANGRTPAYYERKFFCEGCQKWHGPKIVRWGTEGKLFCTRQYDKLLTKQQKEREAILKLPGTHATTIFFMEPETYFDYCIMTNIKTHEEIFRSGKLETKNEVFFQLQNFLNSNPAIINEVLV